MDLYENSEPISTLDTNSVLTSTFFRMFLGLLASGLIASYVYYSGLFVTMIENGYFGILGIAEIIVVLVFSLLYRKLSPLAVTVLFYAYAFLNGFTLSVIFAAYDITSVGYAFGATALFFGTLSFIGYKTKKDISNWGTILTVALFIGIILTVVNLFLGNSSLEVILDWVILFIFFGLTIYDMNKIKLMGEMGICADEKLYIYGAMELYLDFINIFLRLLALFGKRKD